MKKKYDIKQVGTEITKIKPEMENMLKMLGEGKDFINYIRVELQKCVSTDDLIKALAIISYTIHNTEFCGNDLVLIEDIKDTQAISTMAYESGHEDFASNLIGFSHALHFVE